MFRQPAAPTESLRHNPNTPAGRFGSAEAGTPRRSRLRRLALRAPSPRKLPLNRPHDRLSALSANLPPQKAAHTGTAFSYPCFAFLAQMTARTVNSTTAAASRLMTAETTG